MRFLLAAAGWALLLAAPASAHHAFAAEFDAARRITLTGVVTKVEWSNPHTYFYLAVNNQNGAAVNWICEAAGPNTLLKLGWQRGSVKVGDRVTVDGYPARGGAYVASARAVTLPDGHKIAAGSAYDGGPQPK